jgi:hypothetical integral membrane protein (TIGR02206 family)
MIHLLAELEPFRPFTRAHVVAVAWTGAVMAALIIAGVRAKGRGSEPRVALVWSIFGIAINVWSMVYWSWPGIFNIRESLPLQLCDLAALLAPLALLRPRPWARALMYFWGIGLSTQAFVTPTLKTPFPDQEYFLFWLVHTVIVGTAFYDIIVRGFRPKLRDYLIAVGVSVILTFAMFGLNIALKSNYWYVGDTRPDNPTIIDKLGPWPQRVFILSGIVIVLFSGLLGISRLLPRASTPQHR